MGYVITTSAGRAFDIGTADTLQAAIYSLRGPSDQPEATGGTVWIWGDITLARRVDLISGVCLDFMGHTVTLVPQAYSRRASFAYIGRTASHCTIRNATVISSTSHSTPFILIESRGTSFPPVEGILLEDLVFYNTIVPDVSDEAAPIGLLINASNGGIVQANTFQRLRFENVGVGILFNKANTGRNRIQDNFFHDIFFAGFRTMIQFYPISDYAGYGHNLFNHVRGRASFFTRSGFDNIAGEANHFDHCSIDHWDAIPVLSGESATPDWTLNEQASYTYICAHIISAVLDGGSEGPVFDPSLATFTGASQQDDFRPGHPSRGQHRDYLGKSPHRVAKPWELYS